MNKVYFYFLLCLPISGFGQESNQSTNTSEKKEKGFVFELNNGDYVFHLGGFIQPQIQLNKKADENLERILNINRAFFLLEGRAMKEKISFELQTDFALPQPLLNAFIGYHPLKWLSIYGGQKQNFVNTREMQYREDRLQFMNRGLLNQEFNRSGREFGLFVETQFGNKRLLAPKFSVTSGDGRNSFGVDSRDVDLGGVKIGGRLDFLPLGKFKEGNDLYSADLQREEQLKIVFGVAASRNFGASNAVGEGHGDFLFYDDAGAILLPQLNKIVADLSIKYKGFSSLVEFTNASAAGLNSLVIDTTLQTTLAPSQISQYLVLGNGLNLQMGYVFKKGLSVDLRYERAFPEFGYNTNSVLREFENYTLGLCQYIEENNLRIQALLSQTRYGDFSTLNFALMMQLAF